MTARGNGLFTYSETSQACFVIDFGERDSNHDTEPEDYRGLFTLKRDLPVRGGSFTITGRNTVVAYFAAAYYLALWGAKEILCRLPNRKEYRLLSAPPPPAETKPWLSVTRREGVRILANPDAVDGKWGESVLENLYVPADLSPAPEGGKEISVTGRGPILMYAALGVAASCCGNAFRLSIPASPFDFIFSRRGFRIEHAPGSRNGRIIGILGDPNSGKSVFSRNFAEALKKVAPPDFTSWFKDCDKAAPTPDWYLVDSSPESRETQIRKRIKVPWSEELEKKVRQELLLIKTRLDLLIADMPGGKHPKDPAERDKAERIPGDARAGMFRACDGFIVLCRDGEDRIFDEWRKALAARGLDGRILARFDTYLTGGEKHFSMTPVRRGADGLFRSEIRDLDRSVKSEQIIPVMTESSREFIRFFTTSGGSQQNVLEHE